MREIKFRGKDRVTGEWVYGFYVGYDTIIPTYEVVYDLGWIDDSRCKECDYIGQFTGLYDKNGKGIYEGDIVDVWSQGSHLTDGIIKWGRCTAGFFIGNKTI